jgi:D-alanine-D-alanine ligase
MKVALLMGGRSAEREISLRTGRGVANALRALGHEVLALDAANGRLLPAGDEETGAMPAQAVQGLPAIATAAVSQAQAIHDAEVVFIALHGGAGEDGTIQALLELTGRPYTGSGVLASALAMNKAMSKRVFEREGIPTPRWLMLTRGDRLPELDVEALGGWPLVVKPNTEGSTVGLTIVEREADLMEAIETAAIYGPEVMLEEFIPGRELTVAVLGDEALPIVEIQPKSGFYDYENKYTAGRTEYFCPADLPESLAAHIRELGVRSSQVLGCRGVTRADFRLSPDDVPYCLEVNTIPGMTPLSLVPMAAKAAGLSYEQLVDRMIDLALQEWRRRHASNPAKEPTRA